MLFYCIHQDIPRDFAGHTGMVPGGSVRLRSPKGTFRVKVGAARNRWWFRRGWHRFSERHFIESGDAIEVRHVGGNLYDVYVYARAGCVREFVDDESDDLSTG